MEPEVRERFERIEATLALTAETHRVAMEAFNKRMAAAEKYMAAHDKRMADHDKRMAAAERRMTAAEKRMDRFDASLAGIRKLVVSGMQIVNHIARENREG